MTGQTPEKIESNFSGKGYAQLKQELAEVTVEFLKPFQDRVRAISDQDLTRILAQGRDKAKTIARHTMNDVLAKLGLEGAGTE
jgi:tryptophanyl-tRNA synthetase